mmetsp:Transcript_81795/g.236365  ORF Transcript_81795/g.236365 Transcript_81795/m.236365 type:complete len:247 (-) Transcript_81795:116-856(-)
MSIVIKRPVRTTIGCPASYGRRCAVAASTSPSANGRMKKVKSPTSRVASTGTIALQCPSPMTFRIMSTRRCKSTSRATLGSSVFLASISTWNFLSESNGARNLVIKGPESRIVMLEEAPTNNFRSHTTGDTNKASLPCSSETLTTTAPGRPPPEGPSKRSSNGVVSRSGGSRCLCADHAVEPPWAPTGHCSPAGPTDDPRGSPARGRRREAIGTANWRQPAQAARATEVDSYKSADAEEALPKSAC